MVRRPARRKAEPKAAHEATGTASEDLPPREAIIAAFMRLLATKRFEEIGLAEIAAEANVPLSDMREMFNSSLAILAAHVKDVDRQVLAGGDSDMAEEPPRERLFDVLMRRLEIITPHKAALRSLMRSVRTNPCLALALNDIAVRSQQWMLTAAGISSAGPAGMVRAQGLAVLFARVLRTFVDDEEDNARTMAELDRALARGQRWVGLLNDLCRLAPRPGRRRRRRIESEDDAAAA
jgi:AcrR family transcriptional regulator